MSEILFLSHRIPYPPDKGDKIRSYHLLRALAERHTVHLGTFIDDPSDWKHVSALKMLCGETCIRTLEPRLARLRSATALLQGEALTTAYYRDYELHRWAKDLAKCRPLRGVFVFSSSMGQFAEGLPLANSATRVMDFCDVDSDKWRQYACAHRFPLRQIYAREARTLARIEARYVREFDAALVISEAEARVLPGLDGAVSAKVRIVPNGVDSQYFDPDQQFIVPFNADSQAIVFTGAMDYHANVDGVCWFALEVLPAVRERVPGAVFVIVGSSPAPAVRALADQPGVMVTGRVPDVRPYLAHAAVVVAPLRIARGVQNKVLEALAMARPVVASPNAVQGIPDAAGAGIFVSADPIAMADAVTERLSHPLAEPRGRLFIQARYAWAAHLKSAVSLFDLEPERSGSIETG